MAQTNKNISEKLKLTARQIFKKKAAVIAVALSCSLLIGVVFATVIIPLLNRNPSANPWDYAMFAFASGESLTSSANTLTVDGDVRSNGAVRLSGGAADISGFAIAGNSVTSTMNTLTVGEMRENADSLEHNNVFENIHNIAGGSATHYSSAIYCMQSDPNILSIMNNTGIPFLRTAGSSNTNFSVSQSTRAVTVRNRGGTSQGIQVVAADINAVARPNHSYKIEFSGRFPNDPTAIARIREENPSGATLATANAVDGHFTVSTVRTAAQIAADTQAGIRYSLGNVAGNIDIVYTRIVITELPPVATKIYDMQTDSSLSNLRNNNSVIPFLRTSGSTGTTFTTNVNSNPRTVTVTNRGGTSQGLRVVAADINAVAKPNHIYVIEYTGRFPNNPTATARIRVETTNEVLATADAVSGNFTVSVARTSAQIAADAQAGRLYSLGNTEGNINIVYTGITITEMPASSTNTMVYNMQADSNLSNLRNNTNIPFMRGVGGSNTTFNINMNANPRTVAVAGRSGTSQGIQLIAEDINAIAKPHHMYMIEFSGHFPNNPTADARIRIENPTGDTLATTTAVNGEFTVSVLRTAAQIAADAQAGLRYSLGNVSGNIDIVYTNITITEVPIIRIFDSFLRFDESVIANSAIDIRATETSGAVVVNSPLLSESHILINCGSLYGGAVSRSVIASKDGDIVINADMIDFYGIIYAPNGRVTITGSGTINGRIFAQEIVIVSDTLTIIAGDDDISHLGFISPQSDVPPETTPATTVTETPTTPATEPTTSTTTAPTTPETSPTITPPTDDTPRFSEVEYEYDDLGRLTRAVFDDENYIVYEYDANGNITRVTRVVDGIEQ
jgi:YD repeat-containing protein